MTLAPGLRIRVSSRGVRAGIGPRALRLHVGTGRPGVSTGFGPFGANTSLARATRLSHTTSHVARQVSSSSALTDYQKAGMAAEIERVVWAILNLHRVEFVPNTRLIAPTPATPDRAAIHARHKTAALQGVSVFDREARHAAAVVACSAAEQEIARLEQDNAAKQWAYQQHLDQQWHRLISNDPDIVSATLAQTFEDNDATAVPVGIEGGTAAIAVLVPDESFLPVRRPSLTAAGNLSLRQATTSQQNSLYVEMIAGYILATIKEAFAVCPGLLAAKVVAFRARPPDAYGRARAEVIAATTVPRQHLAGIRWHEAGAADILNAASVELHLNQDGRTFALKALTSRFHEGGV